MKFVLFVGVGLAVFSTRTANAQITVVDPASILQQVKSYAQEIQAYTLQARQFATQALQYQQEVEQYIALVHEPALQAALGLINQTGLNNDLPINPAVLQGLVSGSTSPSGILGALGGLANTSYGANHIYSPTDGSWVSQQLIANGNSVSNTQGAAQAAYLDLRNHMPVIQALRGRLLTATTPKDVADAQSQIEAETLWTHNLNSQLAAVEVNYRTQMDARRQRDDETLEQGIDAFITQANAAGRGIN